VLVAAYALTEPKVMAAIESQKQLRRVKDTQRDTLFSPTQAHDGARSALEASGNHMIFYSQSERIALEGLYDATNGDSWGNNAGWKTASDLNSWFGVTATSGTVVTAVFLAINSLAGGCVCFRASSTLHFHCLN
jgi:hypothetical protein